MMTQAALNFITPLTLGTLSENPVLLDLFALDDSQSTVHIDWARWPDVIVISPATLNVLGKIASGIADDAVTTTIMASTAPVIFCPAMNKEMYANKIYQSNQEKLIGNGYHFVAPGKGELACGEEGWGRLAELEDIMWEAKRVLFGDQALKGKKVLITAGPTREPIDPVRFISNRSSGKMGFALAEAAALHGADVTLVSGPSSLKPFPGIRFLSVQTAAEMANQVTECLPESDVLVMAAAVSDYRPKVFSTQKIKRDDAGFAIEIEKNDDILLKASENKGSRIHVGFSVETENEVENSLCKLRKKNLDLIVVNNPLESGSAFESDTNKVFVIDKAECVERYPLLSKIELADKIVDRIIGLLKTEQ
jgi:phosphopantothenoylcysteine decarboxylase/phosphopantothenate--cysteine ligase